MSDIGDATLVYFGIAEFIELRGNCRCLLEIAIVYEHVKVDADAQ